MENALLIFLVVLIWAPLDVPRVRKKSEYTFSLLSTAGCTVLVTSFFSMDGYVVLMWCNGCDDVFSAK